MNADRENGKQSAKMDALLPTPSVSIYIYVHLSKLRHTPPAIEGGNIFGRDDGYISELSLALSPQCSRAAVFIFLIWEWEGPPTDIEPGPLI